MVKKVPRSVEKFSEPFPLSPLPLYPSPSSFHPCRLCADIQDCRGSMLGCMHTLSRLKFLPGREYKPPPPPLEDCIPPRSPMFWPEGIFQGRGGGLYFLKSPAAGILYPPLFHTPPPLEGSFQKWGVGVRARSRLKFLHLCDQGRKRHPNTKISPRIPCLNPPSLGAFNLRNSSCSGCVLFET